MLTNPNGVLPTIVHHSDYEWTATFSTAKWKSITVPDQAISIREILERYSRGQAVPTIKVANSDIDTSMYDNMDRFDKLTAAAQLADRARLLEAELATKKAAASKKRADAAFERAVSLKADAIIKEQLSKSQ